MDPSGLPEHLQPLIEGVEDDLTMRQSEELASCCHL